jgi:hypothetical protein
LPPASRIGFAVAAPPLPLASGLLGCGGNSPSAALRTNGFVAALLGLAAFARPALLASISGSADFFLGIASIPMTR